MNANLMRAHVQFTVYSYVDESCTAHTARIYLAVCDVFNVHTLYFEWKKYNTVLEVLDNDIFLSLIFTLSLSDFLAFQISDVQIVSNN